VCFRRRFVISGKQADEACYLFVYTEFSYNLHMYVPVHSYLVPLPVVFHHVIFILVFIMIETTVLHWRACSYLLYM
jgi:hypothetical protein